MENIELDKKVCTLYFEPPIVGGSYSIALRMGYPDYWRLRSCVWSHDYATTRHNTHYEIHVVGLVNVTLSKRDLKLLCDDLLNPTSPNWWGCSLAIVQDNWNRQQQISPYFDTRHHAGLFPPELTNSERCLPL